MVPYPHGKASLPVRLGGLGLHQAGVHSAAIFLGSVNACGPLISLSGQTVPRAYYTRPFVRVLADHPSPPLMTLRPPSHRSTFLTSLMIPCTIVSSLQLPTQDFGCDKSYTVELPIYYN